jgi:oligoendopeptidase F
MSHLPCWNLDSIFPGLESPEFVKAKDKLNKDIAKIETFFDSNHIRAGKKQKVTPQAKQTLDTLLDSLNRLSSDFKDIRTYLYLITSVDAFNDVAQAELSKSNVSAIKLSMLNTRFTAWLGRFNKTFFVSSKARAHRYALEQSLELANHQMNEDAERLASELFPSSSAAWGKLHGDLVSRTTLHCTVKGVAHAYTLSELKSLQADANESVRKRAFEAERKLLAQNEVSFAAALNGLKGSVNQLNKERGWTSALEQALFHSGTTAKTLTAMQQACKESFPIFRRYLKAKATLLGKKKLAWYDLSAPLNLGKVKRYSWQEAKTFAVEHFRSYSETLATFAKRSFDEAWHDVPPRKGKTNGAYCADIPGRKESRIMHNFDGTLDSLFTLAHELGHAYHNDCLYRNKRTSLQSEIPMTLAETASIFCETIVVNALLANTEGKEKLAILEQDLQGATGLVMDIYSRFILEDTVFQKRQEREVSIQELKDVMLAAQKETYGDALTVYHDLMWAHKGHYYIAGLDYYNFPYTFGYLFALGLYADYQRKPAKFHERYDTLLGSSGLASTNELADTFGIDIESIAFWQSSLRVAKERVSEFERLANIYKPK